MQPLPWDWVRTSFGLVRAPDQCSMPAGAVAIACFGGRPLWKGGHPSPFITAQEPPGPGARDAITCRNEPIVPTHALNQREYSTSGMHGPMTWPRRLLDPCPCCCHRLADYGLLIGAHSTRPACAPKRGVLSPIFEPYLVTYMGILQEVLAIGEPSTALGRGPLGITPPLPSAASGRLLVWGVCDIAGSVPALRVCPRVPWTLVRSRLLRQWVAARMSRPAGALR
jgi:hypothetical protein